MDFFAQIPYYVVLYMQIPCYSVLSLLYMQVSAGLRNPNFFPLRTPHPCLVIRHMVPTDIVFMTKYPPQKRMRFLAAYLADQEGKLEPEEEAEAREALRGARLDAV